MENNLGRARTRSAADTEPPTSPTTASRERATSFSRRDTQTQDGPGVRRRSSAASRLSRLSGPSIGARSQGNFTLAGPTETPQLRAAQEPFVHPGYADLNPSYDQAANAKPVWSLAKPMPRVVRSGMVPTKDELRETLQNAERPAQNSQELGLNVDPNDLEQGQIDRSADPRKMAAQVEDARLQREANFMKTVLSGGDGTSVRPPSGLSRLPSVRQRRSSVGGVPPDLVIPEDEEQESPTDSEPKIPQHTSDQPLQTVPEEPKDHDEKFRFPILNDTHPDDLHSLVQNLVEDEVHNNHTTWSVIRTHHREALAEALAVYIQLTIAFCANLGATVANNGNPNTTQWAWGFATMIGIYISGGVSGAHLNPAVTTMLWFYRGFPKRKMPEYFTAQFLGAFCAALTAYGLYYQSIHQYRITSLDNTGIINSFVSSQREAWIDSCSAFFTEFLGTAFLAATILALGDDQNAPPGAGMNSLIIGLVITCLCFAFSYPTGAALNPSRDFGPRLALLALGYGGDLFRNLYWFYGPWAGAVSGAFAGGFLYDFFIFEGGESPVNYPLERTQRAMRKSRMKWERRLHLTKKA
ncbi:hypothetical protein SI65_06787 [Aspergillus cristatus]|uniref:MIP transporter n=1 Tax=Aspergillus cristatus TaxID=573508 RepID=A0A1E3BAN6_ASPCR|nr:hypothetical protein SI65_06787 [Aspergillus cristatus]